MRAHYLVEIDFVRAQTLILIHGDTVFVGHLQTSWRQSIRRIIDRMRAHTSRGHIIRVEIDFVSARTLYELGIFGDIDFVRTKYSWY